MFYAKAPYADIFVVYAKTNPNADKPQHGISAFIVEKVDLNTVGIFFF